MNSMPERNLQADQEKRIKIQSKQGFQFILLIKPSPSKINIKAIVSPVRNYINGPTAKSRVNSRGKDTIKAQLSPKRTIPKSPFKSPERTEYKSPNLRVLKSIDRNGNIREVVNK